jgi:deoxyribonuclease-4
MQFVPNSLSTPAKDPRRYPTTMPILGAHQSIAGGYHKAVERAVGRGCNCVQLFTKNNNQWRAKPITAQESEKFRQTLQQSSLTHPLAHDSYLINLASPDPILWRNSLLAFVEELRRAELLGIPFVVTHPGCYTGSDEKSGIRQVIRALYEIHDKTQYLQVRCLLETTAGQGTALGWRFEQLAAILDGVKQPGRLGICFDTCHVFAAGYPLSTTKEYSATMKSFDRLIGLGRIKAFHLNDSRRELGSRVDRHEHIGRGRLGLEPFRLLLNDRRFQQIPMYLETPKDENGEDDWDAINLATLRTLDASVIQADGWIILRDQFDGGILLDPRQDFFTLRDHLLDVLEAKGVRAVVPVWKVVCDSCAALTLMIRLAPCATPSIAKCPPVAAADKSWKR